MEKILKKDFCLLLATRPHSVIGKEIALKDGNFVKILDVKTIFHIIDIFLLFYLLI